MYSASVGVQTQRYFPTDVSRLRLPVFREGDRAHREVVRISKACHNAVATDSPELLAQLEMELAEAVSHIWGISSQEIKHLLNYYSQILSLRSYGGNQSDTAVEPEE